MDIAQQKPVCPCSATQNSDAFWPGKVRSPKMTGLKAQSWASHCSLNQLLSRVKVERLEPRRLECQLDECLARPGFIRPQLSRKRSSLWTLTGGVAIAMASASGMVLLLPLSQSVGIARSTVLPSRQRQCAHGRSFLLSKLQVRELGGGGVKARRGLREQKRVCDVGASAGAGGLPLEGSADGDSELEVSPPGNPSAQEQEEQRKSLTSWWKNWQTNASEMRAQVAKLGLAAVLAYGLFDGITYTSFFVLAFLGYEKSTGQNPAANLKALLGVVVLMWTGNNVTRPLRVAGAAALAPLIDRFLKKTQEVLKLPNQAFAFMIVVASFASLCFSVVGVLILSRWGK